MNMRKYLVTMIGVMVLLLMSTCKKDPQVSMERIEIKEEALETSTGTFKVNGTISYPGKIDGLKIYISEDGTQGKPKGYAVALDGKKFSVEITGLKPATNYRYYYSVKYGASSDYETETKVFTTEMQEIPEVETAEVTDVTETTALVKCEVTSIGDSEVDERGVYWSTEHSPTPDDEHIANGSGLGVYTCELTGLKSHTKYYVCAYAKNGTGTGYGEMLTFTTDGSLKPIVTTGQITDVSWHSAHCYAEVTDEGVSAVTERGVCWSSTSSEPSIQNDDDHADSGMGGGHYAVWMHELTAGTTYHVRAYAINNDGIGYGEAVSFTTDPYNEPVVTTDEITDITRKTAVCHGTVIDDGGDVAVEKGACWSMSNSNPTIENCDSSLVVGHGIGSFEVHMIGLEVGTTYHVRAYAKNGAHTKYGECKSFTTESYHKPEVKIDEISNISYNTAVCKATVTYDGGDPEVKRGVCWSTSHEPDTLDLYLGFSHGTGSYEITMPGLNMGTTYYVRAYVLGKGGENYSEEVSFSTESYHAPMVRTDNITNVGTTTALCHGTVTSTGGAPNEDVVKGACWSTSNLEPDLDHCDGHFDAAHGLGEYSVPMSNLIPGTTYYVRTYARNPCETGYGNTLIFTTAHRDDKTFTAPGGPSKMTGVDDSTSTMNVTSE